MKVFFEAENWASGLCWILNLTAIRPAIGHCKQFCDTDFAFWQDTHCQNSFDILAFVALDLVAMTALEAYVEHVFSVCSDMYPGKRNRMSIIFIMES